MSRAFRCLFSVLLAAGPFSQGLHGQTVGGLGDPPAAKAVLKGDDLHARHRPREALDTFQELLDEDPTHYGALWRASREAVSLGILTRDEEARQTWYRNAEGFAARAVDARPEGIEGHHWLSVALSRRAGDEGPRTRIQLAQRVREEALFVLERDSLHAGAHEVLGQWHAEVMRLNGITRFLARKLLGAGTFEEASWAEGERHLRRAVELSPEVLMHRLVLARLLVDRGEVEEARRHLREVLERPALDPVDPVLKQEAQELLRNL
ncbi:MAG: hypothetical protein KY453_03785 [Gemmatimonadetes bacterium]|nr:hypothetical protein [Gemmatimonadota bacterium]